jgi:HD-GYP domain-containing protein (c-di-GMP phosphodiesterase class II)
MEHIKVGGMITSRKLQKAVTDIIDDLLNSRETIIHLTDIRSMQDYTFGHSVGVCVLSVLTGLSMGYNQLRLKELGSGALLHDVGKARLSDTLLNSDRIYSPDEFMMVQQHAAYGFEILRRTENISSIAAHVAWQHHERYNGKGYPCGLAGDDIHEFARIVAIADVYDALTTDRPYRKKLLPYEVVEIIRSSAGSDFDPQIVDCFVKHIAVYPLGCLVKLNTGQMGVVVRVKKEFPTRPAVRILKDQKDRPVQGEVMVDMITNLTVFVTEVIKD